MVMFATLVVPLYLVALSGIFPLSVSDTLNPDTLQPLKASEVRVPMPAPARPLPFLSVPLATEDVQLTDWPAVVSDTTVFPAVPVTAPPGLTVQVTAARAGAAAKPITDAAVAPMTRAFPQALRIALTSFPACRLMPRSDQAAVFAAHHVPRVGGDRAYRPQRYWYGSRVTIPASTTGRESRQMSK